MCIVVGRLTLDFQRERVMFNYFMICFLGTMVVTHPYFLQNTEIIRFNKDGQMEVGEEGDHIYLSELCHHQNDSCIKIGSDESHFNV